MLTINDLKVGDKFTFKVGVRQSSIYKVMNMTGKQRVSVMSCENLKIMKAVRNLSVDKA